MRTPRLATVLIALTFGVSYAASYAATAPAQASTSRGAPVSPTGRVVSQTPAPLTSIDPVPGTSLVGTDVSTTRWTSRLVFGRPALLEGQVLVDDGALPDAPVTLYARPVGGDRWTRAGSTLTSSDTGLFEFDTVVPTGITDYRVVYDGGLVYSSSGQTTRVQVARRVRDALVRLTSGDFRLRGSLAAPVRDKRVYLQRRTCSTCSWSAVSRTSTDPRSRWSFDLVGPTRRGTWFFRAVVPADSRFVTSYGDHVWSLTRS